MTIGIDIDDTISKTTKTLKSLPNMTDEYFDNVIRNPQNIPDLEEALGSIFSDMDVFDDVVDVINYLKETGHRVVLITARGSRGLDYIIPITDSFLQNKKIVVDKVIYNQERKGNACFNEGVDVFIDDNEIVLDEVATFGIKTIRFCELDVNSNHHVLHSWQEIKKFIDGLGDNYGKNN